MKAEHFGVDQYGKTYHALGPHPRKALLGRLGRKHADKIYRDTSGGKARHVGWVIAGRWIAVMRILPLKETDDETL